MKRVKRIILKSIRKVNLTIKADSYQWRDESRVQYSDQDANDYILNTLQNNRNGLMICKFGTIELDALCCYIRNKQGITFRNIIDYINGRGFIFPEDSIKGLVNNAGFFPSDLNFQERFATLMIEDIKDIDILASYIEQEKDISYYLNHCVKVNLDGYYAPFKWNNPWTKFLEGKRVLVIHPFVDTIKKQYENREKLFDNKDVLPEFKELILIKAVQSIAGNGNSTGFNNWFEALDSMINEMDQKEYDVLLVGCGAYGLSLAAHAKRKGKIAIHLAGWTQMLFGIYGNRWIEDQPEYRHFINEFWVRPSNKEKPLNVETVENACYW